MQRATASLEATLLGVPMVIVYRMHPVSFALARRLSDLTHIGMPNLIASRPVIVWNVIAVCVNFLTVAAYRRFSKSEQTRSATSRARG